MRRAIVRAKARAKCGGRQPVSTAAFWTPELRACSEKANRVPCSGVGREHVCSAFYCHAARSGTARHGGLWRLSRGLTPLVLDRRTRDHQIKVALLLTNSFELRTLSGVSANNGEAQRQHGKVSVICLVRAPFCSLRTDFSAPKSNSASTSRGMPTSLGSRASGEPSACRAGAAGTRPIDEGVALRAGL